MSDSIEGFSKDNGEQSGGATPGSAPDEGRLLQAVQQYLRELESGKRPNRQEWLARYPDLGPALEECLEGLGFMHQAASAMRLAESKPAGLGFGLQPGMPLGDFEIVREIGRGGMGIVYEAIQLSLGRPVALKTLPFAASLDPRYLQRFRQEAQAAAQLHHANIVPVYAVGCERGVHFYAMQLIDGQSLDCIIRHLGNERFPAVPGLTSATQLVLSSGSRALDVPATEPLGEANASGLVYVQTSTEAIHSNDTERIAQLSADLSTDRNRNEVYRTMARMMAQAAEALEYAHRQGIIHRDIKPANLLVDMRHHLWVADFGLAHLHGDEGLTRTGDVVGTIRYASPEQLSGQRVVLDNRTDLYSLGATFYELVTLRPVFAGITRQALLHQILNQDPMSPRAIDRSIPHELDTILLKLLSKIPADRYRSAQEVADDLHRFLRDEPILAQPPSMVDHLRKWGRRHPSYVVAAVLVMFITLVISGVSNWMIAQANSRTRTALQSERNRAEEAEENFRQARQAVDYMIQVSENDLADKVPLQPLQKQFLETALVYYQGFLAHHRGNSAQEAELLAVEQRLRKVLDDLSVLEGAGQLILLSEKDVQADLALGEADRGRFNAIARQFDEQRTEVLRGYQHLTPLERRSRFLELARTSEQVIRSILSEGQLQRLRQIDLQTHGPMVFSQPEIVSALKLTESQRQSLRQIEAEMFLFMREEPGPGDTSSRRSARDVVIRSIMERSLAVLTPEQMVIWKGLIGTPFHGQLSIAGPRPFAPP